MTHPNGTQQVWSDEEAKVAVPGREGAATSRLAGSTAHQDVFDYSEMFYNPKRKRVRNGILSTAEFEKQRKI